VHWGSAADTAECVHSLERFAYAAHDIVVIDNGTAPGSLSALRQEIDVNQVEFIRLDRNMGYAAAANRGLDRAREKKARFAWLLNNDLMADEPDSLERLLAHAQESKATITAPRILNRTARGKERASLREYFFPGLALTFHSDAWPVRFLTRFAAFRVFLSGAAMFIDLDAAPVPFFDEQLFAYFEDLDVCLQLGEDALATCEHVCVHHKVSRGTGGGLRKHYLKARNFPYVARKHGLRSLAFRIGYRLLFLPIEARKYLHCPRAYWQTSRRAARDARAEAGLPRQH